MTQPQSEQQQQRRRGLLKAVAGAPVIFTLSSGANVAAASLTCIDKQSTLPTPVGVGTPTTSLTPADTWVRYRVERMTIKIVSPGLTINTAFLLGGNRYMVVGNTVSLVTGTPHPTYQPTPFTPKQYYYLLVDHANYSPTATPQTFV